MNDMDHETFHALELDALYEELDPSGAAALAAHAASCEACGARFERLRRTRQRGLAALSEKVSDDFESRVMSAVDAALAQGGRRGGLSLVKGGATEPAASFDRGTPHAPSIPARPTGKVVPFFSRPSFAVAASFVLLIGAAVVLSQKSMSKSADAPSMAANDRAPAVVAASPTATAAPADEPAASMAAAEPAAPAALGAVAANDSDPDGPVALAKRPSARTAPAHASPPRRPADGDPSTDLGGVAGAGSKATSDSGLAGAKALYFAGHYAEALPRFESLKASNPEAELYAARCIRVLRGCAAAAPRFAIAAQRNAGTSAGAAAQAEGNRCTTDQSVQAAPAATAGPGTPGGGRPAAKAAAPLEAPATSTTDTQK